MATVKERPGPPKKTNRIGLALLDYKGTTFDAVQRLRPRLHQ